MSSDRRRKSRRVSADRRMTGERETMLAIVVQQWGEPSVLEPREVEVTEPKQGEALVRVEVRPLREEMHVVVAEHAGHSGASMRRMTPARPSSGMNAHSGRYAIS